MGNKRQVPVGSEEKRKLVDEEDNSYVEGLLKKTKQDGMEKKVESELLMVEACFQPHQVL